MEKSCHVYWHVKFVWNQCVTIQCIWLVLLVVVFLAVVWVQAVHSSSLICKLLRSLQTNLLNSSKKFPYLSTHKRFWNYMQSKDLNSMGTTFHHWVLYSVKAWTRWLFVLTKFKVYFSAFYIWLPSHSFSSAANQAANPGCILEDFVRWYSPLDWREEPGSGEIVPECQEGGEDMAIRGYLSVRMQCEGTCFSPYS